MRFISSLLIIALASTTLTTQIAAACGYSGPRLLSVSTEVVNGDGKWMRRSFVLLPSFATPPAITLIGPSGMRVVETRRQVGLSQLPRTAVEVPVGDYENFPIAIVGRASDAKWHSLGTNTATDATKKWLAKRGTKSQHVKLRAIPGRNVDVVQYWVDGKPQIVLREGNRQIGSAAGGAFGAVTIGPHLYVVYSIGDAVRALQVPGSGRGGTQR